MAGISRPLPTSRPSYAVTGPATVVPNVQQQRAQTLQDNAIATEQNRYNDGQQQQQQARNDGLIAQQQQDQAAIQARNDRMNAANQIRSDMIYGMGGTGGPMLGGGGGGAAAPGGAGGAVTPAGGSGPTANSANGQAARDAAFARAKDKQGQIARSGVDALRGIMSESGALGSGMEAAGQGAVVAQGQGDLADFNTNQLEEELARMSDVEDRNYAGGLTVRGQDISERTAGRSLAASSQQALMGLLSSLY